MASGPFYGDAGHPREPAFDLGPDEASPHAEDPNNPNQLATSNEHASLSLPLFTLVEDATTSEYHHPTVQYIFADDDTELVTEAGLRSLEDPNNPPPHDDNADPEESALLPPPIPGIQDNYVVIDIEPLHQSGHAASSSNPAGGAQQASPARPHPQYTVTSSRSLSSSWQVLSSELVPAPTFENGDPSQSASHGLMLKIRGAERVPPAAADNREKTARLEDMMEQFSKRMSELRATLEDTHSDAVGGQLQGDVQDQGVGQQDELETEHGHGTRAEAQVEDGQ